MGFFDNAVMDVLTLALLGAVLMAALRLAGWAIRVLPVSRAQAELTERLWPAVAAVVVVVYLLVAANVLLGRAPHLAPFAGVAVLALFVALSWWVLRDTVSGVFLRAGRTFREGDFVHIDDVEGHVERLGWRAMIVVTHDGNEAIIPYSRAAQAAVIRTPGEAQASPHVFQIPVADHDRIGAVKDTVRRAALLSHWSSIVREPEVRLEGDDHLEVTVYSLDAERSYEIEAAVRAALNRAKNGPGTSKYPPPGARTEVGHGAPDQ